MILLRGIRLKQYLLTLGLVISLIVVASAENPKLIGAFFVKGKVGLNWQTASGISEYNIYRKSATEEYQKIGTSDKNHYFDTELSPGSIYTYKISAVDASGNEMFSDEKSVTIPGVEAGDFKPPTWTGLRVDLDQIFLNWDKVPGAMAYNIYRSQTSGTGFEVIGNSQNNRYSDKDGLVGGETYFYVVTALNSEFEETEYSEERSIKFGFTKAERDSIAAAQTETIELEPVKLSLLFEITKAGSSVKLNQPADVFVNSKGNIYITDSFNKNVHCFNSEGKHQFSFGEPTDQLEKEDPPPGSFSMPMTLFIDKNDQVYVTDVVNNDIQVFTEDGKFIKRIKVKVENGQEELRPNGLHVLDDGRIILTDAGNHRFLIIDQDGNVLLDKGGRGSDPGQFNFPDEITVTSDNIICVVDAINARVQEFDMKGNFIRAFGEIGQSAGQFGRPKAIAVDEKNRIWVSDGLSHMVQCFTVEGKVKSVLSEAEDKSLKIATPRGIFFKDGKLFLVNRVPNLISVYKIG